ncbi:hypothetical protein Pcinc_032013 [Petrolisthes cinctipes]|uniref:Uncharacterized protein n=1 Tax=Petrolisthes cinctipes TaxID=88211 RepID=A0AAE1EVF0_PETCI|nr:hypothetical protein Pcinc_032013 [Petrolisthes cinctipes]
MAAAAPGVWGPGGAASCSGHTAACTPPDTLPTHQQTPPLGSIPHHNLSPALSLASTGDSGARDVDTGVTPKNVRFQGSC